MFWKVREGAAELGRGLLDFVFPRSCPVCDVIIHGDRPLCGSCVEAFQRTAREYHPVAQTLPNVDAVSVLMPYTSECRLVIHALKYHTNPAVGDWLGNLLATRLQSDTLLPARAIIVPVPLHPKREIERGYNQSECIARGIAANTTELSVHTNLLARTRATTSQTQLSEEARRENVRGVFRYTGTEPLDDTPVIIVDDVLTTGSTISECACVLKAHGAGSITVCVAATPQPVDD